jgi:hypothetical protein
MQHLISIGSRTAVEQGQRLICVEQSCTHSTQLGYSSFAIFGFQSFNRILNHGDTASAIQQSLRRETNAVFGHHAEDYEFNIVPKSLQ